MGGDGVFEPCWLEAHPEEAEKENKKKKKIYKRKLKTILLFAQIQLMKWIGTYGSLKKDAF